MSRHWYVIRTNPQSEHIAATSLEREGLELFFPRVRRTLPRDDCRLVPLFPGYLFLRYDVNKKDRLPVQRLPGISGWVRFGGVVPPVPDEVVSELAQRVETINSEGGLWSRYRRGDTVRVVSGKMDGLAQVVDEPQSPQARVRVLLHFMGRLVPAQVSWQDMRPVQQETDTDNQGRISRRTRGRGRWIRGFGPRAARAV